MDVPKQFIINDTRDVNQFHKMTYSGYLRKDVLDILFKKIDESSLEEVCFWCAEVVVSGYFEDLWERIIIYYAKYINSNSPYVPYHIFVRLNQFLKLSKNEDFKKNFLDLRNSQEVRNHFCELVCIISNATKMRKPVPLPKVNQNDFSKSVFEGKLMARDYSNAVKVLNNNDPQELTIIVNEFSFHISDNHFNLTKALYWLSWTIEWEKTNIKKYGRYDCAPRQIVGIEKKCQKDFIWIFWEILLLELDKRNNENQEKQVRSLFEFYKYKYSPSKKRKRINLLITAVQILSPEFKFNTDMNERYPVYEKLHLIVQACANINIIYKEKKTEENLENNIINSRIKQDTTFCVTKFSDISLINDRQPRKPKFEREKDYKKYERDEKNKLKKLQEEKKKLKMDQKFDLINSIDTSILQNKNRVFPDKQIIKPILNYDYNISPSEENKNNKTISLLDEIDRKIKNKGKKIDSKTKDVFIVKKE